MEGFSKDSIISILIQNEFKIKYNNKEVFQDYLFHKNICFVKQYEFISFDNKNLNLGELRQKYKIIKIVNKQKTSYYFAKLLYQKNEEFFDITNSKYYQIILKSKLFSFNKEIYNILEEKIKNDNGSGKKTLIDCLNKEKMNLFKQSIFIEELKDKIIELNKIIDESTLYYFQNDKGCGGQNVVFNEKFGYKIDNNQLSYENYNNGFISKMLKSSEYIVLFYNEEKEIEKKYYLLLIEKIQIIENNGFKSNIILKKEINKDFFNKYIILKKEKYEYIDIDKNAFEFEDNKINLSDNFKKIKQEIKNQLKGI